ncbi:MAG: type I glyceraldehyde-3-phosphate dehydrogenase [Waddliaceae bacterium]
MARIAINGFGRIGRLVARMLVLIDEVEIVAVNDLVPIDNLAYLFKYDSTHGRFDGTVDVKGDSIHINGKPVKILSEPDPAKLPWKDLKIDYVIEASGRFTSKEQAQKHITAGAKRVLITAPAKGQGVPTFAMGVNHKNYDPSQDTIVSNASCTTNCLAPITKVLLDNFGIEEGLMTTIHAVTATQPSVDGPSQKNFRIGRGSGQNIIPSTTGAAKAVALCLPEVEGKLTGMAFRVPVENVSVVDLTVKLSKPTTYDAICEAMKEAAQGELKGILSYCDEPLVSTDFIGSNYSAIFDKLAGIALSDTFFKLIAWYDNEMGYATRIVDLLQYIASKEQTYASQPHK